MAVPGASKCSGSNKVEDSDVIVCGRQVLKVGSLLFAAVV